MDEKISYTYTHTNMTITVFSSITRHVVIYSIYNYLLSLIIPYSLCLPVSSSTGHESLVNGVIQTFMLQRPGPLLLLLGFCSFQQNLIKRCSNTRWYMLRNLYCIHTVLYVRCGIVVQFPLACQEESLHPEKKLPFGLWIQIKA